MTFPSMSTTSFNIDLDKDDISETEFLKNSIAHHVKYGSTSSNRDTQAHQYVTHYVDPNDTLQGLSLKYGCKIEDIKKCNKLFTDDNNHLRSRLTILIPIESKPIVVEESTTITPDDRSMENGSSIASKKLESQSKSLSLDNNKASPATNGVITRAAGKHPMATKSNSLAAQPSSASASSSGSSSNNESLADFLIRIDSSIAKTKSQVGQASSKILEDGFLANELSSQKTRKKFASPKISPEEGNVLLTTSSSQSNLFPFDDIGRVTNHNGNTKKKVKSSFKKFEKKHEEIFEL